MLLSFRSLASLERVNVYSYHLMPPYMVDEQSKSGLYYDFIKMLNEYSDNYTFNLIYIPRKRLDYLLKQNALTGAVIGVNPKWFRDNNRVKYLWTDPIMSDKDVFVRLKSKAIIVETFADLTHKRVVEQTVLSILASINLQNKNV